MSHDVSSADGGCDTNKSLDRCLAGSMPSKRLKIDQNLCVGITPGMDSASLIMEESIIHESSEEVKGEPKKEVRFILSSLNHR